MDKLDEELSSPERGGRFDFEDEVVRSVPRMKVDEGSVGWLSIFAGLRGVIGNMFGR